MDGLFSVISLNFCIRPLPMQLNPAGSARVSIKVAAAKFLGYSCTYLSDPEQAKLIWPRWPALRALLLPRLRLIYNGLAALIGNPELGGDNGRRVLAVIVVEAGITAFITAPLHFCGGSSRRATDPDPLVEELAQVLLQPQFLGMVQAGAAWARQHAHLDFSHIYPSPVSVSLEDVTEYGMACLHYCFCPTSSCPVDPSSPKLLQAAFSWFAAALHMIKAGGWQGLWPTKNFLRLLKEGLGIPLVIMICRSEAEAERIPQPLLPWADRPRCLDCALQAAEWVLSAAGAGGQCDDGYVWNICNDLVNELHESGVEG